jgi:hypothetical protein
MALTGIPASKNLVENPALPTMLISGLWIVILLLSLYNSSWNLLWGALFAGIAMLSFSGVIQWINYLNVNSTDLQLFMTAWDLVLSMCLLIDVID